MAEIIDFELDDTNFTKIFNDTAPGSENVKMHRSTFGEVQRSGHVKNIVRHIVEPGFYAYLPQGEVKAGILIVPGGFFKRLVFNFEGTEVAKWLSDNGFAAFVLTPRLPICTTPDAVTRAPFKNYLDVTLIDTQRTMRYIRANAAKYGMEGKKLGVCGFSAGGHACAQISTFYDAKVYEPVDEADKLSAKPDFCILGYPALSDEFMTEALNVYGDTYKGEIAVINELSEKYNVYDAVNSQTPQMFIFETDDDKTTLSENSLYMYSALRKNKVPAELHIFKTGSHGFGLGNELAQAGAWKEAFLKWFDTL